MTFLQAVQRLLPFLVVAVFAWSFWPVRAGDFVIDDYVFLAQSQLIESPLAAFWSNHFYEPIYFRPIGIVIWWLATVAFGMDYPAHALINLGLHAINILLLNALLAQLGIRVSARLAAVMLFAVAPFTHAAVLWPSNRFDLLAVLFLLSLAIVLLRYFDSGRWPLLMAAAVLTAAACLGKEIAFPIATAMACLGLAARQVAWHRRLAVFTVLGATISLAFIYRHVLLPAPYAVAGNGILDRLVSGLGTWMASIPELARAATIEPAVPWLALAGWALVLVALVGAVIAAVAKKVRVESDSDLSSGLSKAPWHERTLTATVVIVLVSILVQAPLAWNFREMLPFEPLGTVTFARFYYLPMASLAVVIAMVLARTPKTSLWSTSLVVGGMMLAVDQRGLSERFAHWTSNEIKTMSVAATATADEVSAQMSALILDEQPCILVFLDTQHDHPWFRMFSDVTVKARAQNELTWRCYVMTESTPWLFMSAQNQPLPGVGLPATLIDSYGTPLEDIYWSGVRYRYRQAPSDTWSLPGARYFSWQEDHFVEVTAQVHAGEREVEFHRW